MKAQKPVTLSSFTNPNGVHVHQVMFGGMPITRETTEYTEGRAWALSEARKLRLTSLVRWDGDTGTESVETIAATGSEA